MAKRSQPGDDPIEASAPLLDFVTEIAKGRHARVSQVRLEHLVVSAVRLVRGASSGEVEVGIVLLEQFRAELIGRGR